MVVVEAEVAVSDRTRVGPPKEESTSYSFLAPCINENMTQALDCGVARHSSPNIDRSVLSHLNFALSDVEIKTDRSFRIATSNSCQF